MAHTNASKVENRLRAEASTQAESKIEITTTIGLMSSNNSPADMFGPGITYVLGQGCRRQ